jgi:uncharacterized protein (DUF1015 family)
MSISVMPFRGLRPKPHLAGKVASPPYDVLSVREARQLAGDNPDSFLRVNRAELEFDDDVDPCDERVYRRGKENLERLVRDGVMVRDAKPCFYLYRLTMDGRSQTGLVALASVDEYDRGKIKKHEHTRPEKVRDRADHIDYLEAQVGPVFTTYRHDERVGRIFERIAAGAAVVDFVAADAVRHELWVIEDDPSIREIGRAFAAVPCLYIADGHHRSQSASEVCRRRRAKNPGHTGAEPYNFFLTVIFPDSELRILPYNRVIKDVGGQTLELMLERASESFDATARDKAVNPDRPHCFGLYANGRWYRLTATEGSFDPDDPTGSIDAAILDANFIKPILGVTNPIVDDRVDFVGGIRGTEELVRRVDSGEYTLAFALHATTIEQLLCVADAGAVMPPKSTWFEPKLRSGMVVNLLYG